MTTKASIAMAMSIALGWATAVNSKDDTSCPPGHPDCHGNYPAIIRINPAGLFEIEAKGLNNEDLSKLADQLKALSNAPVQPNQQK